MSEWTRWCAAGQDRASSGASATQPGLIQPAWGLLADHSFFSLPLPASLLVSQFTIVSGRRKKSKEKRGLSVCLFGLTKTASTLCTAQEAPKRENIGAGQDRTGFQATPEAMPANLP